MPADALTTNHMPLRLQSSQQQKKDLLSPSQLAQHEMGGWVGAREIAAPNTIYDVVYILYPFPGALRLTWKEAAQVSSRTWAGSGLTTSQAPKKLYMFNAHAAGCAREDLKCFSEVIMQEEGFS